MKYTKIGGFSCGDQLGKRYDNLYEAKTDCSFNNSCIWIVDSHCSRNDHVFAICTKNDKLYESEDACVYEKPENRGKFIPLGWCDKPL